MARLRQKATQVPGMQAFFQSIQNLNIGGRPSKSQYQYTLQSGDTESLYRLAPEMRDKIAKVPGLLDVTTDLYIKNPQMTVDIDREKAAVYGITVDQVRNQLYNAYGARQVGTIYMPSNDYQIILEAQPQFRVDPSDLSKLYMKTANNQTIPLDAVARLVPTVGPLQINHQGQQPAVTISFNLAPNYSLGYAVDEITAIEQSSNLPATIATGFSGTAQVFQDSLRGQGVLILAAVFAAFVILGILYESFIHPITIISGLPSAGIGAILTLMMFNMELSVIAMIGIVMLVGIVKKNAIMMVDFALERRRVGLSAEHAIREAALLRFRPIMMTTFAAIFGTLPIAIGAGAGAELRQPLGVAVVGGLCVSQLLTLFITPVIYIYLDRIDRRLKRRLEPQADEADKRRAAARRRGRVRPQGCQIEKLVPQPQDAVALGLTTRNDAPIRSSTKSTSDPARNGTEAGSTSTTALSRAITRSSSALRALDVEFVLKAGAAAALDADAQHGAIALGLEDFPDAAGRPLADDDTGCCHDVAPIADPIPKLFGIRRLA